MRTISSQDVEAAWNRYYVKAQYAWVQMLAEHLTDCSRVFRGDLQSMLVLAIIGQSYMSRYLKQAGEDFQVGAGCCPDLTGAGINASSLAEILGIPRETVRRKLEGLRAAGWIERDERACWQLSVRDGQTAARAALLDLDRRQTRRIARFVAEIGALTQRALDDACPPPANGGGLAARSAATACPAARPL